MREKQLPSMPLSGKDQRSMEDHFVFDGKAGWQQEESKKSC
jgi:hypothetical protein